MRIHPFACTAKVYEYIDTHCFSKMGELSLGSNCELGLSNSFGPLLALGEINPSSQDSREDGIVDINVSPKKDHVINF